MAHRRVFQAITIRYKTSIAGKTSLTWIRSPKTWLLLTTKRHITPEQVSKNLLAIKNHGPNSRLKDMMGLNSCAP